MGYSYDSNTKSKGGSGRDYCYRLVFSVVKVLLLLPFVAVVAAMLVVGLSVGGVYEAASWMWNHKSETLESLLLGAVAAGLAFIAFGMASVLVVVAGVVGFITALAMFNLPVDYSKYTPWVQPAGGKAMGRYALLTIAVLGTVFGVLMVAGSMPAFGISLSAATPVLAGLGLALAPQIAIVAGIALVASSLMMVALPNVMESILGCFKDGKMPQEQIRKSDRKVPDNRVKADQLDTFQTVFTLENPQSVDQSNRIVDAQPQQTVQSQQPDLGGLD